MSKLKRKPGSRWNGFLRLGSARAALVPITLLLTAGLGCGSDDDDASTDGQQTGTGSLTPAAAMPTAAMPPAAMPPAAMPALAKLSSDQPVVPLLVFVAHPATCSPWATPSSG